MSVVRDSEIGVVDPRTGREIAVVPVTPPQEVAALTRRARDAGRLFAALPLTERKRVVSRLGDEIFARASALAEALCQEIGKPAAEAWPSEILTAQELFQHWLSAIDDELADVEVSLNPLNYPGKKAWIELHPVGVIGLIMPWNYPLNLPLRTIVPALLAGNAVVFKPSEHAALVGQKMAEAFAAALPPGLVTVVQGGRAVGEAIIDAGVDKVVFTGSVATGRAVATRAAAKLIPSSLELGGKDPAIVLADADLERAANGIVWGAFHNAGQDCASVERCYVDRSVYPQFLEKVVAATRALRAGADVAPLANEQQLAKVRAQVDAAVAGGAKAVVGGSAGWWGPGASPGDGWWFAPTVLTDLDPAMEVMVEETFGPVLPIVPVSGPDEAVELANSSRFALTASVWGKDRARAAAVLARIDCGVAYVNNCCFTGPMGGATWGGRRETGSGVTGGRFGLHGLVTPRTVCVDRSGGKREMWWYPYSDALTTMAKGVIEVTRSGGAKLSGAQMAVSGLLNRWK